MLELDKEIDIDTAKKFSVIDPYDSEINHFEGSHIQDGEGSFQGSKSYKFPSKLKDLFNPSALWVVAYGGRGGMKTWNFARAILVMCKSKKIKVCAGREFASANEDSLMSTFREQIELLGMGDFFEERNHRYYGRNGSEIFFRGFHLNVEAVKGLASVDIVWIDEAETLTKQTLDLLIPTLTRYENCRLFISFNPNLTSAPVWTELVIKKRSWQSLINVNYWDNPWLTELFIKEANHKKETDYPGWLHEYCGVPNDILGKTEFDLNDIQVWEPNGKEIKLMNILITVDPARSKKKWSDYTCMLVIGYDQNDNRMLIDGALDKIDLNRRTNELFRLYDKYRGRCRTITVAYETNGNTDIEHIQSEQGRIGNRFPIIPLNNKLPKEDRIRRFAPYVKNHRFYLPFELEYVREDGNKIDIVSKLKREMSSFPFISPDQHDDTLDNISNITSDQLIFVRSPQSSHKEIEEKKQEKPFDPTEYDINTVYNVH